MRKLFAVMIAALLLASCAKQAKMPVYVWGSPIADETAQREQFALFKQHGVTGVCYNCGWDMEQMAKSSALAHEYGLEYHAWIPTMIDGNQDPSWYTVNRLGESAYDHPAYVPYYKTLDPHNPEVIDYLVKRYSEVAAIPTVDYVQLDYIRYADVILSRGLWDKYGLDMNEEYAPADYCYCDDCVADFKAKTGIDIRAMEDPSKCEEWAEFRCNVVTALVNRIAAAVHQQGKKISADVFPGPDSYARWMVRQQWNDWAVDAFFPMNYNDFYLEPASWVGDVTREEVVSVAERGIPVYSGLFICKDWQHKDQIEDPEGHGLLPSEMEEAVLGALDAGAAGICLFSAGSMTPDHWAVLDRLIR